MTQCRDADLGDSLEVGGGRLGDLVMDVRMMMGWLQWCSAVQWCSVVQWWQAGS